MIKNKREGIFTIVGFLVSTILIFVFFKDPYDRLIFFFLQIINLILVVGNEVTERVDPDWMVFPIMFIFYGPLSVPFCLLALLIKVIILVVEAMMELMTWLKELSSPNQVIYTILVVKDNSEDNGRPVVVLGNIPPNSKDMQTAAYIFPKKGAEHNEIYLKSVVAHTPSQMREWKKVFGFRWKVRSAVRRLQ